MLSNDELKRVWEVQTRASERTPGDWKYDQFAEIVYAADERPICDVGNDGMTDRDGFFIANAAGDIDFLLALVRRLASDGRQAQTRKDYLMPHPTCTEDDAAEFVRFWREAGDE